MVSKVVFELKSNIRNWSNQIIDFCPRGFDNVYIEIHGTKCNMIVSGENEMKNYDYIVAIWELLAWQDGYFYKPVFYEVDNKKRSIKRLVSLKYRITDKKWISSAMLLCRSNRQITEEIIDKYMEIRYKGRKEQSMNASMFSAFFCLISKSYANINLEHRLVLLMHICDGLAIQFFNGSPKNNSGNINIILRNLDVVEYKNGAQLLGIESSKAMNALGNTRNELTHFIFKQDSLGSYIDNPNTETDNMVNLYAFYILENALRISVLEILGIEVSDEIKTYIMNDHLDWIKLEKHLEESCVLPMNVLRQMIGRLQREEKKIESEG